MKRTDLKYIRFLERLSLTLLNEWQNEKLAKSNVAYWDEERGCCEYLPYTAAQFINKMQQNGEISL